VFAEASAEDVPFGTEPPWAMTVAASGAIADAASTRTRASVVQGVAASTSNEVTNPFPFTFMDTHALSSTITYKIQAACRTAGVTLDVNRTEAAADNAGQHFGASCLIVQEIPV
jgi:hypothetical protein